MRGNPVNLTDPSGRIAPLLLLVAGAAALGGLAAGIADILLNGNYCFVRTSMMAMIGLAGAGLLAIGGAALGLAAIARLLPYTPFAPELGKVVEQGTKLVPEINDVIEGIDRTVQTVIHSGGDSLLNFSSAQTDYLANLGLSNSQIGNLAGGGVELIQKTTETSDLIYYLSFAEDRFLAGIYSVKDTIGAGAEQFAYFRNITREIAALFGYSEYELQGMAVINERIAQLLLRQGYELAEVAVPDALGGGMVEVFRKIITTPK